MGCELDNAVTMFNSPSDADVISQDNGSEVFGGYPVEFRVTLSDVNHDTDDYNRNVTGYLNLHFLFAQGCIPQSLYYSQQMDGS